MLFRLNTFGELALHDCAADRNRAVQRKALALLAVLAVAGKKGVSRERILALLWPESSEEAGRGALKQTVYEIRRALGNGEFLVQTGNMALEASVIVSDVDELELAYAAKDWSRVTEIHRGPFLEGVSVKHSPEFERWSESHRARYKEMLGRALEHLASGAAQAGDLPGAIALWRRVAAEDPLSSRSAIGLMTALSTAGDHTAALLHYDVHQRLLREEFDSEPHASVAAAMERIKAVAASEYAAVGPVRAPVTDVAIPTAAIAPVELPRPQRGVSVLIVVTVLVMAAIAFMELSRRSGASGIDPVSITAFENRTGDQELDALGMMVADQIVEGVVRAQLAPVVEEVDSISSAHIDGARVLVTGRIYADADSLRLHGVVTDASSRRVLAAFGPLASARSDDPLLAVRDMSDRVVGALARVYDRRLRDVMDSLQPPPRAKAYHHYIRGLQLYVRDYRADSALHEFRAAYALDTNFVTALVWSVWSLRASGRHAEARLLVDTLVLRRSGLSPLHRDATDAFEAMYSADWDGASAAAARAAKKAPQSEWAWYQADLAVQANRPRDALRFLRGIDPSKRWLGESAIRYWDAVAIAQHVVGDFAGEAETIRAAPSYPSSHLNFLRGLNLAAHAPDSEILQYVAETLESDKLVNVIGIETVVREMAEHRRGRASGDGRAAMDSVLTLYEKWLSRRTQPLPDRFRFAHANVMYSAGRFDKAESELANLVRKYPQDLYFAGSLARTLARRGDSVRARALLASFEESQPYLYKHQSQSVLVWRAQVEAWLGNREEATELLAAAFRNGLKHLHIRHSWESAFPNLRGYAPFDELVRSR